MPHNRAQMDQKLVDLHEQIGSYLERAAKSDAGLRRPLSVFEVELRRIASGCRQVMVAPPQNDVLIELAELAESLADAAARGSDQEFTRELCALDKSPILNH